MLSPENNFTYGITEARTLSNFELSLAWPENKEAPPETKLVNILFHGIGGDHLSVAVEEHRKFIEYLAEHKSDYWIDAYLNIMTWVEDHGSPAIKICRLLDPPYPQVTSISGGDI